MDQFPPGICNDKWRAVPRQKDADSFYMHCTGGFRAAKASETHWYIEPVFENGEARTKGFLAQAQVNQLIKLGGLKILGFQSSGWFNGEWHSSWRPIIPNKRNHAQSPAVLWRQIASGLFDASRAQQLKSLKEADHAKIAGILDDRSLEERLAQSISLSLRSLDLAIEQIAEHYHEQLVNMDLSRLHSGL